MRVEDDYRTNDLSFTPGGVVVCVEINGKIMEYDKVKYPDKFINKALKTIQVQQLG